jgi:hypothetical protein
MIYYKFVWGETRGDEYDKWGTTTYYFEVGDDLMTVRQLEVYENGNALFYDESHWHDKYGGLSDKPVENLGDLIEISKDEFEQIWDSTPPTNR